MARNPLIRSNPPKLPTNTLHKSAGILDDHAIRKNIATKEGTIEKVPVNNSDIVNKLYVDGLSSGLWQIATDSTELITTDQLLLADNIRMQSTSAIVFRHSIVDQSNSGFLQSDSAGDIKLDADADLVMAGGTLTQIGNVGDTTFGDGTLRAIKPQTTLKIDLGSNALQFNDLHMGGDLIHGTDGGGLVFGEIYVEGNSTADTITTATSTQMSRFDTDGESNLITPSHTNDHLTITKAGKYLVTISISFSGDNSVDWKFTLCKNNGASNFLNVHTNRKLGSAGDIGSASMSGIVDLAVNDTVELWMEHSSGVNKYITIQDCTMSVVQVGG